MILFLEFELRGRCHDHKRSIVIVTGGYIPQCNDADGLYKPKQCHETSNDWLTCWCVHTDTGHKVEGTLLMGEDALYLNCGKGSSCIYLNIILSYFC